MRGRHSALVHPVAGDAVAVQVAAVGDDVERRLGAVVHDGAELQAPGQVDLGMPLDAVTPVLGVRTPAQVWLRGHLQRADEVERVVLGLRQRVGDAALEAAAEALLQIDQQRLVADVAVVRVEALVDEVRIGPHRVRAGRRRRAGNAGVDVDDPDVVVAAVVEEADVEADIGVSSRR